MGMRILKVEFCLGFRWMNSRLVLDQVAFTCKCFSAEFTGERFLFCVGALMSCEMSDSFTGESTDGTNEWVVVSLLMRSEMDLVQAFFLANVTNKLFLFSMNFVMSYQRIFVKE